MYIFFVLYTRHKVRWWKFEYEKILEPFLMTICANKVTIGWNEEFTKIKMILQAML